MAEEQEGNHPYAQAGLRPTAQYKELVLLWAKHRDQMWRIRSLRAQARDGASVTTLLSMAQDERRQIVQQIIALELALGLLEKVREE